MKQRSEQGVEAMPDTIKVIRPEPIVKEQPVEEIKLTCAVANKEKLRYGDDELYEGVSFQFMSDGSCWVDFYIGNNGKVEPRRYGSVQMSPSTLAAFEEAIANRRGK